MCANPDELLEWKDISAICKRQFGKPRVTPADVSALKPVPAGDRLWAKVSPEVAERVALSNRRSKMTYKLSYKIQDRGKGCPNVVFFAEGEWCGERLCEDLEEAEVRGRQWVATGETFLPCHGQDCPLCAGRSDYIHVH